MLRKILLYPRNAAPGMGCAVGRGKEGALAARAHQHQMGRTVDEPWIPAVKLFQPTELGAELCSGTAVTAIPAGILREAAVEHIQAKKIFDGKARFRDGA